MTKLWSDEYDYNKLVEKCSDDWKGLTRASRRYRFVYNNMPRRLDDIFNEYDISSVLDYGSGYSTCVADVVAKLAKNIAVVRYDPFIVEMSEKPTTTFDAVVCHNVLGSVEMDYILAVIQDLCGYSNRIVVLKVTLALQKKAEKIAHSIEQLTDWNIKEQSIHTTQEYYDIYSNDIFIPSDKKCMYYLLEKN